MTRLDRDHWQHVATRLASKRCRAPRGSENRVAVYAWREVLGLSKFNPLDSEAVKLLPEYSSGGVRLSQRAAYRCPYPYEPS